MTVTFFGHHDACLSTSDIDELTRIIIGLMKEGADYFLLGGYGNFDTSAANAVRKAKENFPTVRSVLVIPYPNRDFDKSLYDESVYPPIENVPRRFAISKRNNWMVENADVLVVYVTRDWGGAYKAVSYAERKGKRVVRLP